ncbi:MAG TPA: folylpolyglutamate synthase/dihydrofolate synthase family protein [Pyrinomonadaceae bacterium]|nr:folylpolyglutamate synthase/dihydrofolate synthase family protein [Pyrinomonadaceae bacterium]
MNFQAAVEYLLGLGHETLAIKLGLRNTELLLAAVDNPERAFPSVQIAGTNGKGSTAVMLDSICRAAGIKSGLYTSPHLVSITERIKVSGIEITREDFAASATVVRDVSEQLEALPTFFEQVTAIALLAFRNARVELGILETGLGGRLDSTTAANAHIVGITSIAFDHEEYLGNTIESIAAEKAAIIRPGVRAVIARQPEPAALGVLLKRCEQVGVTPILADPIVSEGLVLGLRGQHQFDNAAVAIGLAELLKAEGFAISDSAIVEGLKTAKHAGRLELIPHKPSFLIDGAHNPAGAQTLREYLDEFAPRPLTLVFGAMRDKQLERMGEILFPVADTVVLTTIDNPRSASIETLQTIASRFAKGTVLASESSSEALRIAIANTPPEGLICIAGSLYLAGEVRPPILSLSLGES